MKPRQFEIYLDSENGSTFELNPLNEPVGFTTENRNIKNQKMAIAKRRILHVISNSNGKLVLRNLLEVSK